MIVKPQGGGKTYANTGTCANVAGYLRHEDIDRMKDGKEPEPFFSHEKDSVSIDELVDRIDNNRKGLKNSDAKFYVITVAPSRKELERMGKTKQEQAAAMKEYIRTEVMPQYAEGFKKDVKTEDLIYFGKIHYERNGKNKEDLHAHIIVARKTKGNGISISPMTNHRNGKNTGAVKGSFDRCEFKSRCEERFDRHFGYERDMKDSFAYQNAMKNGTPEEMRSQAEKLVQWQKREKIRNHPLTRLVEAGKKNRERMIREESKRRSLADLNKAHGVSQSRHHEETKSRKPRIEENLSEEKRKRNLDKGMSFDF